MIPAAFEYHSPTSLREALRILRRYPGEAKVMAGGHSLLPLMKLRLAQPAHVVDLRRIENLAYIREQNGGLAIGPLYRSFKLFTLSCSPCCSPRVVVISRQLVKFLTGFGECGCSAP